MDEMAAASALSEPRARVKRDGERSTTRDNAVPMSDGAADVKVENVVEAE